MVLLPLTNALLDRGWNFLPIISMTDAWAVLASASASSFAAMAATKPGRVSDVSQCAQRHAGAVDAE